MSLSLFTYGKYSYEYHLFREERKTVKLTVYPNLSIVLKCPNSYPEEKVETFLQRKWHWLEKQIKELKKYQKKQEEKEYISGESFLYLGRQYKLIVQKGENDAVRLENGRILVEVAGDPNHKERNKIPLESWYLARAEKVFTEQYKKVLKNFDYDFVPELSLRKMEKRWGSFLSQKKILLNPDLIKASKDSIDYVITHELCHMTHKNHSPIFFKLLSSKMPDWKERKEKLEMRFVF